MFKQIKNRPVIKITALKNGKVYQFYTESDIETKGGPIVLYSSPFSSYTRSVIKSSIKELEDTFDCVKYEYKRRDKVWNSITS